MRTQDEFWIVALPILVWLAGCSPPPGRLEHPSSAQASVPRSEVAPETAAVASSSAVVEPAAWFVNVAEEAGLTAVVRCGGTTKDHILESVGSGCAWIDFDEDGWLDAFVVNAWSLDDGPKRVGVKGRHTLYRNLGNGRFEDVTEQAGVGGDDWGCGVCAADFDNDGHVDLYVTNFGSNRLYRNRGNGTFEDVAERAGVSTPGWSTGAAFFDADADGWLDLYVAKYIECTFDDVLRAERTNIWRGTAKVMVGPFGMKGDRDRFFRNQRDGTFIDATDEAGMTDTAESYGLGVVASDLDGDGDVDVYVGNDSNPNFLYRNDGNGTFTEVALWSGAALSDDGRPQASMGVDAADFDGDGLPEIVTTNFAQDYCTIYRNQGGMFFADASATLEMKNLTYTPVKWGCAFLDYDLDARLDLFIANGHIYPQVDDHPSLSESYRQLPILLRNAGGRFENVSAQSGPGLLQAQSMRGLAVGDYDDDGKPDLLLTAIDAPPILLRNETTTGFRWSKIRLLNRYGSPAINAVARVTADGATQIREVRSGGAYCSQGSFDLHFGLKEAREIETLEIRWPGGRTTRAHGQPVNTTLTFREPEPAP
jgi:hypothetical protein